jgi:MYXO-CTERM domain-containing protein
MRPFLRQVPIAVGLALASSGSPSFADEGQWMPEQIDALDHSALRRKGLELSAAEIVDLDDGGLLGAVINFSGCSAAFVSADGLVATNHHCAYGAIQAQSTVEHDYLADGFVARERKDELEAKGKTALVLRSITDVTTKVREAAASAADASARARAVRLARRTLEHACESAAPARRCRVAEFYNGSAYRLFESIELQDLRLVYAPASGVGAYGGEIDNWMWPRHTGDFTLLRAYVGKDGEPAAFDAANVPYRPARWLETAPEGVSEGDFVMVMGFPGTTYRHLPLAEMRRQLEQVLPTRVAMNGEWIAMLERFGAADPARKIKVAAKLKSLANRHKSAIGTLEGVRRNGALERRATEEVELRRWAEAQSDGKWSEALDRLDRMAAQRRETFERDVVLDNLGRGANLLAVAVDLVRRAHERKKPDLERHEDHADRNEKKLWGEQERRLRDYDREIDQALMGVLVRRIEALPQSVRPANVRESDIAGLLRSTRLHEPGVARALFDAPERALVDDDPLLRLAVDLVAAQLRGEAEDDARAGEMLELGPRYFEMLEAVRGGPVYPDANGTLRLSTATVRGYSPKDGLVAAPQTTLAGALAKHTGSEPFDLPKRLLEAAKASGSSRWRDQRLGDVPVAFLADADTTGGNSGSAVVDGRGRWVGLNFDRVWENVAGDYGYTTAYSRNVVADVRYLLWNLDEVEHHAALLRELGISEERASEPAAAPAQLGLSLREGRADGLVSRRDGCGCTTARDSTAGSLLLLVLAASRPRRRRTAFRGTLGSQTLELHV